MSLGQVAAATTVSLTPVAPSPLRVATTALWLLSLILSLGAALFGILVKQWVREYMRWTSIYPLQHALHVRYHRKENRDRWHIEGTIVIIWTSLVLGLIIFFFGLALLSFDVDLTIAVVATAMIAIVLLAFLNTTFVSVFNPSCPYRTPFSSSLFIAVSYALNKFAPTTHIIAHWLRWISWRKMLVCQYVLFRKVCNSDQINSLRRSKEASNHGDTDQLKDNAHKMKWSELISNSEKLWVNQEQDKTFWVENVWSEWDKVLYLSHDIRERVLVGWNILSWLVSHQPLSDRDSLVVQCFSDLPGPPPSIPGQLANIDPQPRYDWLARDENHRPRLQFEYLCEVLVHYSTGIKDLFKSSLGATGTGTFTVAANLPEFLTERVWNIRFTNGNDLSDGQPSVAATFHVDWNSASRLQSEIKNIESLTGNLLLKCISWLTETVLNSEGQLAFKHIDLDLFACLLSIYFMLVNSIDPEPRKPDSNLYDAYHRMMVNIISADQITRHRLEDATDSSTPMDMQYRIELAGSLLSLSSSGRYFGGTRSRRFQGKPFYWLKNMNPTYQKSITFIPQVKTIILYITAAAQFLNRDRWKLKPTPREDLAITEDDNNNQASYMPTTVFWALATIVFDTGNRRWEELNKQRDYRQQMQPFIRAVQKVLEFEARHDIKWEDKYSRQRGEMTSFLILNYKSIPSEFFNVMKTASEKNIIDLAKMVDWSGTWIISPFSKEWISTKDEYLDLLQRICNGERPNGNADDT
jgi:hypothetical protein